MPDQSVSPAPPASDDDGGQVAETALPIHRRQQNQVDTARRRRSSFVIPSTEDELHDARGKWSEDSWQYKVLTFINSDAVQRFFVLLLLLDVLIMFSELAIDVFYPRCEFIIRDAISCCPTNNGTDGHYLEKPLLRILEGKLSSYGPICAAPLIETDNTAGCDYHKHPGVHVAHEVLHWITIVILASFEIELLLLMYLLGPGKFFRQMIYVMDWIIVTLSLALELIFHMEGSTLAELWPNILIIFRVWRFIRIGHGLMASTYEVQEHKTHAAIEKTHVAMEHIKELEERLRRHESEVPEWPEKLTKSDVGLF